MQLYREAARILQWVEERKGSVKNLTYNSSYHNKRQLYALLCETIKYQKVLNDIMDKCQLNSKEKLLKDKNLTRCLTYDLLFGRGITGSSPYKVAIERHSAALKSCLARIKVKAKVCNNSDLQTVSVVGQFEEIAPDRDCVLECGPDKTCFVDTCCARKLVNGTKQTESTPSGDQELRQRNVQPQQHQAGGDSKEVHVAMSKAQGGRGVASDPDQPPRYPNI